MNPCPRRAAESCSCSADSRPSTTSRASTAVAVARALDPAKYDVVPVGITTDGRWLLAGEAQKMLASGRDALPAAFAVEGDLVAGAERVTRDRHARSVDVVIPLLHGPYGEDGTVQGVLELAGLPYVGAGVLGSAIAMDKIAMKQMFVGAGLETARALDACATATTSTSSCAGSRPSSAFPCFVKPANMGSSVGVSKVRDRERTARRDRARAHVRRVGARRGDGDAAARSRSASSATIRRSRRCRAKSFPRPTSTTTPTSTKTARPSCARRRRCRPSRSPTCKALAVRAFEACRGEAMARVDFFLRDDGVFVVNEVNTIPGFTPISMYPRLWEVSGVPYARAARPPHRPRDRPRRAPGRRAAAASARPDRYDSSHNRSEEAAVAVSAYILIQTEVGKASAVVDACRTLTGWCRRTT